MSRGHLCSHVKTFTVDVKVEQINKHHMQYFPIKMPPKLYLKNKKLPTNILLKLKTTPSIAMNFGEGKEYIKGEKLVCRRRTFSGHVFKL